jgi:Pyridoxal/pyridoxine/pyridoxamine kinase
MRKRIACIHDLASYGGAALMNIIPIMYSYGIEVCPIPTSLFTSHGALIGSKSFDNSCFMKEYTAQYKQLQLKFDGIYLGLFTSSDQMNEADYFLQSFSKKDTLVLMDPIMGDNGKLYSFMNEDNIKTMRKLIKKAKIITPNLTEACIILGRQYKEDIDDNEIEEILISLSSFGPEQVIVTSVPREGFISSYIYNKLDNRYGVIKGEKRPGSYPGTGDAYTAALMAHMLNGCSLIDSAFKATKLIEKGIDMIINNGYNPMEGLPIAEYLSK